MVFKNTNEWFSGNLLSLNFGKTHFTQFLTKNGSFDEINIEHNNKIISNTSNLEFLGIIIDNTLSWKIHKDTIAPKLIQACYIIRRTKPYLSRDVLKVIYVSSSLSYVLRSDFLGEIPHIVITFSNYKKNHKSNNGGQK
jgi:hypothetical protein